ncbi:hypothetical protein [Oceanisphaera profunda]|uniref:hypothetical protein n=1 Tax=Oceanisphaera profunda TaxID=1416627 RepID=UPI001D131072
MSLYKFFDITYANIKLSTKTAQITRLISGIAERAKFWPILYASSLSGALVYLFFEGIVWNNNSGLHYSLTATFGAAFHDLSGSIVVHCVSGWIV